MSSPVRHNCKSSNEQKKFDTAAVLHGVAYSQNRV